MNEIEKIYYNDFGMAFYWRKENETVAEKIQLIFKETGFYFSVSELKTFTCLIEDSFQKNKCCEECALKNQCHKFLLKTPCDQIDLAVSIKELSAIKDLVGGTLFKIELVNFVYGAGRN